MLKLSNMTLKFRRIAIENFKFHMETLIWKATEMVKVQISCGLKPYLIFNWQGLAGMTSQLLL